MPTMNVSLPTGLAEFVEQEVQSGAYSTASEVVRDGLRLLRREKDTHEERVAILKREVQRGADELDRGELSDLSIPDIWKALRDKNGK